jgi:uncharacterized membrane protein YphA (DoxX/SURF4 family)
MAEAASVIGEREEPASNWKLWVSTIAAILIAVVFLASGGYKLLAPLDAAERLTQVLIPANLSVAAALSLGVFEVLSAILLLIPKTRKLGAVLIGLMLIAFCIYIGIFYERLIGEDCGCFPWVKRAVGPVFFISNGIMFGLVALAGWLASGNLRRNLAPMMKTAVTIGVALAVFGGASLAYGISRETGLEAPETIVVAGEARSLHEGKAFLYFFDPECAHCELAGQMMSEWDWGTTKIYAIPTVNPQWGDDFLESSKFPAELVTEDVEALREVFQFADPPFGAFLRRGRMRLGIRYAEFTPELKERLVAEEFVQAE